MQIHIQSTSKKYPHTLLIPLTEGEALSAALKSISEKTGFAYQRLKEDFTGKEKELLHFYHKGNQRIFLLGLGKADNSAKVIQIVRGLAYRLKNKLPDHVGVYTAYTHAPALIEEIVNGILLSRYHLSLYQTSEQKDDQVHFLSDTANLDIIVDDKDTETAEAACMRALATANTQMQVFDLVNRPSNKKIPQVLADWTVASGRKYNYTVKVLDKAAAEKIGLHGLLAVNRGSEYPPVFIVAEYRPDTTQKLTQVSLIGKGVTFDTGGVSIKPSSNMHYMKSDMGGAAAVLGTIELVAKMKLPVHLTAIVPVTDNSVDAKAIKPSDVIDSYSGKTIEIIDTDAEGRLILADGLSYAKKQFNPDYLIDVATLTGSAVRTFGYEAAALFTNNDDLCEQLEIAANTTGERVWRLPIWEVYGNMMKSDVADVKNFSGKPVAGAITAAKFLQHFIDEHPAWAHLDIAGVAVAASAFSSDRIATAFGVRLLTRFLENISKIG